jgi:transcriptional regulator
MMKAIVGFEIRITRLEGKLKLSQNRSNADQESVGAALTRQGDPLGIEVAELMERQATSHSPAQSATDD